MGREGNEQGGSCGLCVTASRGCVVLWSPEGSQEGQPALEGGGDTGRNTGRGCLWGRVSSACQPGPQACEVVELLSYLGTSWWSSG